MLSTRTSIAAVAAFALTGASAAVVSIPVAASPPRSDYCTATDRAHVPLSADAAASWLAGCHDDNLTADVTRQPYYCTHVYLPWIPHTADAIAEWLEACDFVRR
jgi:hypothetical protein